MKAIGTPHHDCSPNYFLNELCGCVTIFTNPQILSYSERGTRSCLNEPKCNSQFLSMVTQMKCLFFFFHVVQNKFCTRHIPGILHEPWQSLQFCMNFYHLWVVSIIYYKCMHLIICFNPGVTQVLLHTFFFPLLFNIVTEMPIANNSIDSWQQQMNCSIFRLQFKNMLSNTFSHLHITMNYACTEQSLPHCCMWFTGHCIDKILCLRFSIHREWWH